MAQPISDEVAACLGRFFTGGLGPRHSDLTTVFVGSGFADADPYDPSEGTPNKETRVVTVARAAARHPARARALIDALLAQMRAHGCFDANVMAFDEPKVAALRRAFHRVGWELSDGGEISPGGLVDLKTGGREALDDQLARLRKATDDPGLLIGTAKELLESIAKFVLEELGLPYRANADFAELWYLARDRLGILPTQVDITTPGGKQVRAIMQRAWDIADSVNQLRGEQGTGHGRTLPTGVSPEVARYVVREACSMAEFTLSTLDAQHGRR